MGVGIWVGSYLAARMKGKEVGRAAVGYTKVLGVWNHTYVCG